MHRSLIVIAFAAATANAQSGSFVATLGRDTVHLERFSRTGNILDGVIVTRVPDTRIVKYQMTYRDGGGLERYEFQTTDADGKPLRHNGASGSLVYVGDSIIRRSIDKGEEVETRIAAPNGAFPGPSIPYVGVTYLMYEEAFAAARRRRVAPGFQLVHLSAHDVHRPARTAVVAHLVRRNRFRGAQLLQRRAQRLSVRRQRKVDSCRLDRDDVSLSDQTRTRRRRRIVRPAMGGRRQARRRHRSALAARHESRDRRRRDRHG